MLYVQLKQLGEDTISTVLRTTLGKLIISHLKKWGHYTFKTVRETEGEEKDELDISTFFWRAGRGLEKNKCVTFSSCHAALIKSSWFKSLPFNHYLYLSSVPTLLHNTNEKSDLSINSYRKSQMVTMEQNKVWNDGAQNLNWVHNHHNKAINQKEKRLGTPNNASDTPNAES